MPKNNIGLKGRMISFESNLRATRIKQSEAELKNDETRDHSPDTESLPWLKNKLG